MEENLNKIELITRLLALADEFYVQGKYKGVMDCYKGIRIHLSPLLKPEEKKKCNKIITPKKQIEQKYIYRNISGETSKTPFTSCESFEIKNPKYIDYSRIILEEFMEYIQFLIKEKKLYNKEAEEGEYK